WAPNRAGARTTPPPALGRLREYRRKGRWPRPDLMEPDRGRGRAHEWRLLYPRSPAITEPTVGASGTIVLAHQLLEPRLPTDRIEVRVVRGERAQLLRAVDSQP